MLRPERSDVRPDPARVAALIREVAEAVILPRFRALGDGEVREKRPGDPVTIADEESEQRLGEGLRALLPGSAVVGEEASEHDPHLLDALRGSAPCWVVDPVDGTANFAEGKACFAVIVALAIAGETVAGWIHDPIANETLYAAAGEGAWLEGRRLRLGSTPSIAAMTGSLGSGYRRRLEARRDAGERGLPKRITRYRCVGREYIDLVRGKLDFARYSNRLKPWDHAAGVLAMTEAGGVARLMQDGSTYAPDGGIVRADLLLAPDEASWRALARLLEAG